MTLRTVAKEKLEGVTKFFGLNEDQTMNQPHSVPQREIYENEPRVTTNIVAENTREPLQGQKPQQTRETTVKETRMSRMGQAAKVKQKSAKTVPVHQEDVLQENIRIEPIKNSDKHTQPTFSQTRSSQPDENTFENVRVSSSKSVVSNKTQTEALGDDIVKKVSILEPRTYTESKSIAQCIFRNEIAIVNFHLVDESQARRIVDFLTGAVFALDGDIQRLGGEIFICTPPNTEIDSATAKSLLETQFKDS